MEVILQEKIRNLGDLGAKVNVKPGYARNFLIPQGKALQATARNLADFEKRRAQLEAAAAEKLSLAQTQAKQFEGFTVQIKAKAGDGGKLFGSIGTKDLADEISKKLGVEIGKHQIRMPEGVIRQIGSHNIGVHLHTDVDVAVTVTVEEEKSASAE